jgi:hypothetical protein
MTVRPLLPWFLRRVLLFGLALAVLAAFPRHGRADDETDPEPRSVFPKTTDADRVRSVNNLKEIGLAMHNYHAAMNALPAAASKDKNGKALLSWRVAILPYVEEQKLYQEFKLDEPWDSKHNKKLIARMPKLYAPPIRGKPAKANTTYYQVFTGPDAMFNPKINAQRFTNVTDGTSNTAMVVEAGEPVIWSKPDDVVYDANKALPKLGGLFKEGFHVTVGDGSTRFIGRKRKDAALRALITPSGGEVFSWNDLPEPEKK